MQYFFSYVVVYLALHIFEYISVMYWSPRDVPCIPHYLTDCGLLLGIFQQKNAVTLRLNRESNIEPDAQQSRLRLLEQGELL